MNSMNNTNENTCQSCGDPINSPQHEFCESCGTEMDLEETHDDVVRLGLKRLANEHLTHEADDVGLFVSFMEDMYQDYLKKNPDFS